MLGIEYVLAAPARIARKLDLVSAPIWRRTRTWSVVSHAVKVSREKNEYMETTADTSAIGDVGGSG